MANTTYLERRGQIEAYFDRTAAEAWSRLTSDAPVSGIRATVRAGRDRMRQTLLSWLPADLAGHRVLDAGCGTGALTFEAAASGANVVALDLSPNLVQVAEERLPSHINADLVSFHVGDMLDRELGEFHHVVAMDSLIHYRAADKVDALAGLADRVSKSILFTFAPRTPALTAMHTVGRFFPRSDRAPAIEPVSEAKLRSMLATDARLKDFSVGRTERITSGFYTSQAMELVRR